MRSLKTPEVVQSSTVDSSDAEPEVTVSGQTESQQPGNDIHVSVKNGNTEIVDQDRSQELQLLDAIYKATVNMINLQREANQLQTKLNDILEELESAKSVESSLIEQLPDTLLQLRDGMKQDSQPGQNVLNESSQDAPVQATAEPEQPDENDWKKLPTASIAKGVVGLGTKKVADLCEQCPTLGDLSNAYAKSVAEKTHFATVLPKGIGKGSADELANRMMAAETGGDTRPASEVVEPRAEKKVKPESEGEPTAEEHSKRMLEIVQQIKSSSEPGSLQAGSLDSLVDSDIWQEGYDAYEDNLPFEACPSGLTQTYAFDWVRGWLAAKLLERDLIEKDKIENGEAEELPAEQAEASEAKESDGGPFNEAFLEKFAEQVRQSGETDSTHDKDVWQQGHEAAIDDQPVIACPPSLGMQQRRDWVRGWVEGTSIGAGL